MKRRIISFLLALSLVIALLPSFAHNVNASSFRTVSEGYKVINTKNATGNDIVTEARKYIGVPYYSGGNLEKRTGQTSPQYFDCSGFVFYICMKLGFESTAVTYGEKRPSSGNYYITADTRYQINYGTYLDSATKAYKNNGDYSGFKPGDLIFLDYGAGRVGHVGIYTGDGKVISAYSKGITECKLDSVAYNSKTWRAYICGAVRLVTCECTYNSVGKCTTKNGCGKYFNYDATLDTSTAGIYTMNDAHYVRTSGPYDAATKASSQTKKGAEVTVLGTVKNHYGNTWYKLSNGYIYTTWAKKTGNLPSSISVNITWPAEEQVIPKQAHNLEGTITSAVNIKQASVYVDGTCYGTDYPNAKNFSLKKSKMDIGLPFNSLSTGKHTMKIVVTDVNGYTKTATRVFYTEQKNTESNTTPGKPVFLNMASTYTINGKITLKWNGTANTTHYNWYLDKLDVNGEYARFKTTHYAESGGSISLGEGKYRIMLQSTNSNAWMDDGSTWKYTNGDWVCFEVGPITATLTGTSIPSEIIQGTGTYIGGTVTANMPINWAWVGVVTGDGSTTVLENSNIHPNSKTFDVGSYANGLDFASLPVGDYYFAVHCTPGGEYHVPGKFNFSVVAKSNLSGKAVAETTYNNHKYELFDYHMSWEEAKAFCEARGGKLVTITSAEENKAVVELAKKGTAGIYYIGCTDAKKEGTWSWLSDETFGYSAWDPSAPEPTNGAGENYGALLAKDNPPNKQAGEWIDTHNKTDSNSFYSYLNCGFICEYAEPCDHSAEISMVVRPTCTSRGYTAHHCVQCKYEWNDNYIKTTGHTEVTDKAVSATCTTDGKTEGKHCSVCGTTIKKQETVKALGHKWDDGAITKTPTAEKAGEKTFTCTVCKTTKTEEIPALGICDGGKTCPLQKFGDVKTTHWAHPGMDFAVNNGLMNGTGDGTTFEPNTNMSRAMLVTVLWRYSGSPKAPDCSFKDVEKDDWFYKAVAWAASEGVVNGVGDGTSFDPNGNVTREMMATILYRYAKMTGVDVSASASISSFPDAKKVASWSSDAVKWAVAEEIISGAVKEGKTVLAPQDSANRAVVATIMMRFIQNVVEG